ncbi:MgtC/SapB family protein [Amycolatopsis sp. cmx-4-54]|uniref:MgtC/SapB family protein n=1 Tax=Amycolatopsis sp. cmx-4-54 TaxID=2790936 RepID=UPI0039784CFA
MLVSNGQGRLQIGELTTAFALSAAIGLERQLRGKSAGLRTQTIVSSKATVSGGRAGR